MYDPANGEVAGDTTVKYLSYCPVWLANKMPEPQRAIPAKTSNWIVRRIITDKIVMLHPF